MNADAADSTAPVVPAIPLFISHSSQDAAAAARIKTRLAEYGYSGIFLDSDPSTGIAAGADWEKELYEQLRRCNALVVLCSRVSVASQWVFAEVTQARLHGKHVIPVLLEPCELPAPWTRLQVVRLYEDRSAGFERLVNGLVEAGLDPRDQWVWRKDRSPYPGLFAFDELDVGVFFGRETEILEALDTLNRMRAFEKTSLLVIAGSSGSGKSSLLRAGIIPQLRRESHQWVVFGPITGGRRPLLSLAGSVARVMGVAASELEPRLESLAVAQDATGFDDLIRQALASYPANARPVLVIDQFEALLDRSPEAEQALALLGKWLGEHQGPRTQGVLVVTLRSDFLDTFERVKPLGALPRRQVLVRPLARRDFAAAIEGPARRAGLDLGPGLVQALIEDAETDDAMPLLAHTLRILWDRRVEDRQLTVAEYRTTLGGLRGAIARSAERILEAHIGLDEKVLRRAFRQLVTISQDGLFTRAVARRDLMPPEADPLLNDLVSARLLVSDQQTEAQSATSVKTVAVAHEAIFRTWDRLRQWLDQERPWLHWRRRLQRALDDWEQAGRDTRVVVRGPLLEESQRWLKERREELTENERAFIERSIDHERRETSHTRQRRLLMFAGLAIAAIAAIVATMQFRARREQAEVTFANQLILDALSTADRYPDRSILLAAEASRLSDTPVTRRGLLQTLQKAPRLRSVLHDDVTDPGYPLFLLQGRVSVTAAAARTTSDPLFRSLLAWDLGQATLKPLEISAITDHGSISFSRTGGTFAAAGGADIHLGETAALNERFRVTVDSRAEWPGRKVCADGQRVVTALTMSAGEELIAYVTEGGEVGVCDIATDRIVSRLPLAPGLRRPPSDLTRPAEYGAIAFSPAADILALGGFEGHVIVYSRGSTIEQRMSVRASVGDVRALAFSDDGRFLAVGGSDVVVLDLEKTTQYALPRRGSEVMGLSFIRRDAAQGTGLPLPPLTVFAHWSLPTGSNDYFDIGGAIKPFAATLGDVYNARWLEATAYEPERPSAACERPGARLQAARKDAVFEVRDQETSEPKLVISGVTAMACGPDRTVFIGEQFGRIQEVRLDDLYGDAEQLLLASGWTADGSTGIADWIDGQVTILIPSADGKAMMSGTAGGSTYLWSEGDRSYLWQRSRFLSKDPRSNPDTQQVQTYIDSARFSPDGRTIAVEGGYSVYESSGVQSKAAQTGRLAVDLDAETGSVRSEKSLPPRDGEDRGAVEQPSQVNVEGNRWSVVLSGRRFSGDVPSFIGEVGGVAVGEREQLLALGNADQSTDDTIALIDLRSGHVVARLARHTNDVRELAFNRAGTMLASGGRDGQIILWDVASRTFIGSVANAAQGILSLEFDPNGDRLVAKTDLGSDGVGVAVWDIRPDAWRRAACDIATRTLSEAEWEEHLRGRPYRPSCGGVIAAGSANQPGLRAQP